MADKLYVHITMTKEVADQTAGRAIYDMVKAKLADHPDIVVQGSISNQFHDEEL